MVKRELTAELIQEGAILIEALAESDVPPTAALWLYDSEASAWELVLAEARYGPEGPRVVYRAILKTFHGIRSQIAHLVPEDVSLIEPEAPLIKGLAGVIRKYPGVNGIRYTHGIINRRIVDDAYIYRLKRRRSPKRPVAKPRRAAPGKRRPTASRSPRR